MLLARINCHCVTAVTTVGKAPFHVKTRLAAVGKEEFN